VRIDLQSKRYLTKKHAKKPVLVMNCLLRGPKREPDGAAMDVLAPGFGEIIGGSQREKRLEVLDRSAGIARRLAWPSSLPSMRTTICALA
jgi:aspartyl/asparaginyl-tRNA synthetase